MKSKLLWKNLFGRNFIDFKAPLPLSTAPPQENEK